MKFSFVGEGLTDFKVIKNLMIGYFNDKNLLITRLLPRDKEPVGWGNVLKYLPTDEFKAGVDNSDYTIIQIDSDKCEDWGKGLTNIGSDATRIEEFINSIKVVLINEIGNPFYETNRNKILFAIAVYEIECWLLPFNSNTKAHFSKLVGCTNTIEKIANVRGFSINQKNYEGGKHYEDLSKGMKDNKELLKKSELNPSLKAFVDLLKTTFSEEPDSE